MDTRSFVVHILVLLNLFYQCTTQNNGLCSSPDGMANRIFIQNVPEDKPIGSVVSHLNITGSDTEIELKQSTPNTYFQFNPVTRNITVINILVSGKSSQNIKIDCTIKAWSQTVQFTVIVDILDLNNNAPQFQNLPYRANISELSPVGTTVFSGISATDDDHSNYYVTYEVLPGEYSDCFSIPAPAQGILVLRKMLDYEQIQTLTLSIVAKDKHPLIGNNAQTTLNATTNITINIQDGDDQNPVFTSTTYKGTVVENDAKGTIIDTRISASDPDVSVNSPIIYSIVQDPTNADAEYFQINPSSGVLTLAKDELVRGYNFTFLVQATKVSNSDRYTQAMVKVMVQAANKNPPHFVQEIFNTSVVENVPIGTVVITVSAYDNDQVEFISGFPVYNRMAKGTILVYSFLDDVKEFTIDSKIGVIQTTQLLDYENLNQHILKVSVTDGTYTDTATVYVSLINTNTHNPQFDKDTYTFAGVREKGHYVGRVKATDADTGSQVKYSFATEEPYFSIDENSGDIEVTANPEDLTESVYLLFVLAQDEGSPPRQGSTRVSITFDPIVAPVVSQGSSNMIIVIVLGVLLFFLVVAIAVLIILLYRKCCCHQTNKIPPYTMKNVDDDLTFSSSTSESSGITLISYMSSKVSGILPEYSEVHQQQTDKSPNKRCVRSRSFEQSIDFSRKDYTSYLEPTKGLAYKPSTKYHLDMYDGVGIDHDGTTTAENPFTSQDSTINRQHPMDANNISAEVYDQSIYDFHSAPDVNFPTGSDGHIKVAPPNVYVRDPGKRGISLHGTTNSSSSENQNSVMSYPSDNFRNPPITHSNSNNIMVGSYDQQIAGPSQYDSHIPQPYDDDSVLRYKEQRYSNEQMDGDISPRSSYDSDEHYNGDLTSFKAGSTTKLMGAPSKPKSKASSNKGSGNISFVDTVDVSPPQSLYSSMTSQRSGMDPGMNTLQSDDGRPGITVYY